MRYGVNVMSFGDFAEPATFQRIARSVEEAGWDGLFTWDHAASAWNEVPWWPFDPPIGADPWILLAAAACVTERIALGTNVAALPRRRPPIVAKQAATLDRLSQGRFVFGVGLGGTAEEFERFGESADGRRRAEMLDEGLEVITALWSGERVDHKGAHYTADGVRDRLLPVQQPRPPIWIGGGSTGARRRASRWDGWTIGALVDESGAHRAAEELAVEIQHVLTLRSDARPFDIAIGGYSDASDAGIELVAGYEAAGATWWCEDLNGMRGSTDELLARVEAGPPRP